MSISSKTLNEFYQVGWEQRWISRLNDKFVPGDAGYKYRLFKTIGLLKFGRNESFTVLDLGCGVGIYSVQILRKFKNARVWGVDLSAEHVSAARELAQKAGVGKRASFEAANVADFCTDINPDVLLVSEVLEHLPDPAPAIENIKRLSTGNTQIIISVPNKLHETKTDWVFHRQIIGKDFENIQTEEIEDLDQTEPRYSFYHKEYNLEEIQDVLISKGFNINRIIPCFFQYPQDCEAGVIKKWLTQKLNYANQRIHWSFLDYLMGYLLKGEHYETIILDCVIKSVNQSRS